MATTGAMTRSWKYWCQSVVVMACPISHGLLVGETISVRHTHPQPGTLHNDAILGTTLIIQQLFEKSFP
jgi:hypothetical protein